MIIETIVVGELATNCYIFADNDGGSAVVIDPADEDERIVEALEARNLKLTAILLTHGHPDHVGGAGWLAAKTGAPIGIHDADAYSLTEISAAMFYDHAQVEPDFLLVDGQQVEVGATALRVLHTPGHTPGGGCLYFDGGGEGSPVLFSGDLLFKESVGRTDFPGGGYDALIHSLRDKILTLPDGTVVYPGHGPSTTIGWEREHNPYLATL